MSDDKVNDLPDLPEMDEVPEHPETPEEPAPAPEAPLEEIAPPPGEATEAAAGAVPDGEKPPLRVLDKAPFYLRKAAVIVVAGSILPWMGDGISWMTSVVAKVVILAGLYLWYQQVQHNWGPKLTGILGKLASLNLKPAPKPKKEDKLAARRKRPEGKVQAPAALEHPFPTGLHVIALLLAIFGVLVLPTMAGLEGMAVGKAIAELGMLAWAAGTFVHIHSYERWGRFSPIFPLMFLAMVFAGLMSLIQGFGMFGENGMIALAMILGGGAVTGGGGLAAYTIVEALMAAKKEGDEKKKAASEARKAQRAARKSAAEEEAPQS